MPIHQQTPSLFSTPEALAHFVLPTGALHAFCLQHQPVTHAPRNAVILIEKEYGHLKPDELRKMIVISKIDKGTKGLIYNLEVKSNKEYCIQLMSIPEYQLC